MPKKKAAASSETSAPAPKKKHRISRVKVRAVKRRRNPSPAAAANPPILTDLTHTILPGFGAYAGTRALARVLQRVIGNRFPRLAKHVPAITGAASFGAVWFGAHRFQKLAPYHDALVMGSAIAAIQNVAQAYLPPRYTWIIGDAATTRFTAMPAARAIAPASASAAAPITDDYDAGMEAHLDQLTQPAEASAAPPVVDDLADLTGDADDLGIFANN